LAWLFDGSREKSDNDATKAGFDVSCKFQFRFGSLDRQASGTRILRVISRAGRPCHFNARDENVITVTVAHRCCCDSSFVIVALTIQSEFSVANNDVRGASERNFLRSSHHAKEDAGIIQLSEQRS